MALLNLVPHSKASHVAVKDGSWFDASTWEGGKIPENGANVLIPKGIKVSYNQQSDARLETVRLDGTLTFASGANTKLVVDTFVNAPSGTLNIGTQENPIQADKTAEIVITADGAIDRSWDPTLLSRGVISHGAVNIHGAEKADFITLQRDVMAGDSELVLSQAPSGWRVGDQLVLGGTRTNNAGSHADNSKFQDEVLTITEINGNRIKFTNNDITEGDNTVLRFDHTRPDVAEKSQLKLYVANTSRNVTFETENAADLAPGDRGHVMFMHNPDVVVQNAGFYNLGRSDKTKLVDDIGTNKDGRPGNGTNIRGRYALHFHRTGAEDPSGQAAIAKGNAVVGSPGWGIVHHDSHAIVEDNVVFDVAGAGIVQEAGNEIGAWRNNITIKTTGDGNFGLGFGINDPRPNNFDFGFNGEGYWVQGAGLVDFKDNIAISTGGEAITLHGGLDGGDSTRDKKFVKVANLPDYLKDIAKNTDDESVIDVGTVPTDIDGFIAYNAMRGLGSWKRTINPDGLERMNNFDSEGLLKPGHDYPSTYKNFKLWNVRYFGVHFNYNSNVKLQNGLVLGDGDHSLKYGSTGIANNYAANKLSLDGITVKNFEVGMAVPRDGTNNDGPTFVGSEIKNSTFEGNSTNFVPTRPLSAQFGGNGEEDLPSFFKIQNTSFAEQSGNIAPTAKFQTAAAGGLAVEFSAGESYDADAGENSRGEKLTTKDGKGIVAYGWDFDSDGAIDAFGRTVHQSFKQAGRRDVTLTVWDTQGAASRTTQSVTVQPTAYGNALQNSSFSNGKLAESYNGKISYANKGWFATDGAGIWTGTGDGGAAILSGQQYRSGIGQIIYDQGVMKGEQTLSLDLRNIESGLEPWELNEISVNLWGINGEFGHNIYDYNGPYQAGALSMQSTQLVDETLGGESFDWTSFEWDVNLGDGYDYFLVQIDAARVDNNRNESGNFVGVDNVTFGGGQGNPPAPVDTGSQGKPEIEEPTEEPKAEEPKAEEPKTEAPKAEEPKAEEPKVEEPKVEEPTEEPKLEEPDGAENGGGMDTPEQPTNMDSDATSDPAYLSGSGGQKRFTVEAGDRLTIGDFGTVGRSNKPKRAVRAEVDTLQFSGEGLSARNLKLTQSGDDLVVSFEGSDTRVTLKQTALDHIENLPERRGKAVGNLLFNGELQPTNSVDIFRADRTRKRVFRRDTVTFLNDLNNWTRGFGGQSGDVINAMGGDDVVWGFGGSDILRGGNGNDRLIGAALKRKARGAEELDVLSGGNGSDTFQLGDKKGAYYSDGDASTAGLNSYALITDFSAAEGDKLKLAGKAEDYFLEAVSQNGVAGTGVYLKSDQESDLVAVVQGEAALDLNSTAVTFV